MPKRYAVEIRVIDNVSGAEIATETNDRVEFETDAEAQHFARKLARRTKTDSKDSSEGPSSPPTDATP